MRTDKKQYLAAKPDVDAAIKKHGWPAVRWVINKRAQEMRLRKELQREKTRLGSRIAELEAKLNGS